MQQAEAWGYRPENSNPCKGIRRYRQTRSERFLSPEEYRRLARVLGRSRGGSSVSRGGCPPASSDRMPQIGDPYPRMAFLPGRKNLSARQQDGPAHGLAVRCSAGCPGPSAAVVPMGLPGRRLAHPVELAGSLLVACEERSRLGGSTTFPPSIGSICAPPTRSKAHSPPCDTVPCDPRDASPTRRRSPWSSNSPRRHRTVGAASTDTTSCPS